MLSRYHLSSPEPGALFIETDLQTDARRVYSNEALTGLPVPV